MKKLYLGIGMVLGAALIGLTGYAAAGRPGLTAKVIGEEKAEEIALVDAGVSREDALMQGTMLEYDGGRYVYDVEFTSGGTAYDYDILAGDGTIVSSSREILKASEETEAEKAAEKKALEEAEEESETREKEILALKEAGGFITVDEAKAIALSDAGYDESGVIMEKARFEKADEDDPASYEIEFAADGTEYEYSVDALTGKILEKDMEKEDSEKDDD